MLLVVLSLINIVIIITHFLLMAVVVTQAPLNVGKLYRQHVQLCDKQLHQERNLWMQSVLREGDYNSESTYILYAEYKGEL